MNQQELYSSPGQQSQGEVQTAYRPQSYSWSMPTRAAGEPKDEPPSSDDEAMAPYGYQEQGQQFTSESEVFERGYRPQIQQQAVSVELRPQRNKRGLLRWILLGIFVAVCGLVVSILLFHPPLYVVVTILRVIAGLTYPFLLVAVCWLPWFLVMTIGRYIVRQRDLPMPSWLEWHRSGPWRYAGSCHKHRA